MERVRTSLCACLPMLHAVPTAQWERVQEVRLRVGVPLAISDERKTLFFGDPLTAAQVQDGFVRLCGQAVHTHQEELRQGFITTRDGFRVGVAGTAVVRDGAVCSYREITSLCVRIPRVVKGCAAPLLPFVQGTAGVNGLLLCGAPASGKTTVLRDLAQSLSAQHHVTVINERFELSPHDLSLCDVLCGCPKTIGILQAVRTLAPDVVIADEIGDDAEWDAVAHAVFCGVPVIASVHAACEKDLLARAAVARALRNGGFRYAAFLPPRDRPGQPMRIRKVAEWFEDHRGCDDRTVLHGSGAVCDTAAGANGTLVAGMGGSADAYPYGTALYRQTCAGYPRVHG